MTASIEAPKNVVSIFSYDSELGDKQYQTAPQSVSPVFWETRQTRPWMSFYCQGKKIINKRLRSKLKEKCCNSASKWSIRFNLSLSILPQQQTTASHPILLSRISPHAAFINNRTQALCYSWPVLDKLSRHETGEAPRALTMEHKRDEETSGQAFLRCYKINVISRVFMNRSRCQIHNFKQIDFQLLVRRSTSRCATDGAGATKGVSAHALCYSAVKRQYSCVCFKSLWAVGWRWREGQGDGRGEMKAHH